MMTTSSTTPDPGAARSTAIEDADLGRLLTRLDALDEAVAIGRRHDLGVDLQAAARIARSARARLRHGTAHTVVALAGSTGSGKSSLLNAITGAQIAATGLTRPTTSATQAVVYPRRHPETATSDSGADGLLDWLGVQHRHHLEVLPTLSARAPDHDQRDGTRQAGYPGSARAGHDLRGLLLLDLPDFDSTEATHRAEVERLIQLVDLMVWVTDPQKYADHALHDGFLAPLAQYEAVVEVVLNKVDTISEAALRSCIADLDRLLDADGLDDIHPLAASATTGHGISTVRGLLAARVAARQAVLERIDADLTVAAARLGDLDGTAEGLDDAARSQLIDGFARAVGADAIAALVAAQHRRDALLKTGWPPLRWIRRFRRAPITALPKAGKSHVARAEVSQALRAAAEHASSGAEPTWRPALRHATVQRTDEVVAALDRRTSTGVDAVATKPRWWNAIAALHGLLLFVALVGALWLVALFFADSLLLIDVAELTPRYRAIPLPTLMLAGGLGGGLLLALLCRPFVTLGARRRARAARRRIAEDVAKVADDEVVDPVRELFADRGRLAELQATVADGDANTV